MGQFASMIVAAGKVTRAYADRLLAGISPAQFARRPGAGPGALIQCNHPAWAYGHLAIYPARIAAMVGLDGAPLAAPAGFEDLFRDGTECRDDPKSGGAAAIYPAMPVITEAFFRTHDALFAALDKLDDARLLEPVTDEKAKTRWPLVGGRVIFMCNNHLMVHLGQVSTWRRCMGLPAA
ncbi:MAG: DinB family protein [Phycisphaerales bacterium]|nr:DinB family protein [Phycisphaerales bacterium]